MDFFLQLVATHRAFRLSREWSVLADVIKTFRAKFVAALGH